MFLTPTKTLFDKIDFIFLFLDGTKVILETIKQI